MVVWNRYAFNGEHHIKLSGDSIYLIKLLIKPRRNKKYALYDTFPMFVVICEPRKNGGLVNTHFCLIEFGRLVQILQS